MSITDGKFGRQKGQATTELVVSIIAVAAILTGFFLIVDLGVGKVENAINARGGADSNAIGGIAGSGGSPILTWTAGTDGYYYTEDDDSVLSTYESPATFGNELQNASFSLSSNFSMVYVANNFSSGLDPESVFLPSANLTSSTQVKTVPYDDATRLLFFDTSSATLRDTAYMPFIE